MPVALSGTSCPFERGEVNLHEGVRVYGSFDSPDLPENNREPDQPHGHLGAGRLAGV
jgi:hypothetical protein